MKLSVDGRFFQSTAETTSQCLLKRDRKNSDILQHTDFMWSIPIISVGVVQDGNGSGFGSLIATTFENPACTAGVVEVD